MARSFDLQVILTSGAARIERARLGLAPSLTHASSGDGVVAFPTIRGASWAEPVPRGSLEIVGFHSSSCPLGSPSKDGARIEACSRSVEHFRASPSGPEGRRAPSDGLVYPGASDAGWRLASTPPVVS